MKEGILSVMNLKHPVVLMLVAAIVLVLIGLFIVERQRAVAPTGSSASWQGSGAYLETTPSNEPIAMPTTEPTTSQPTGPETLVIPKGTSTPTKVVTKTDGSFDYNAMLAQMRGSAAKSGSQGQAQSTYDELMSAFSFAPTFSTPVPKTKTPEELALISYGNAVGTKLQAFAAVNVNMTQTLTNQVNDRTNISKGNAVRDLGLRYRTLGENVLAMTDIPSSFQNAHKTLGESYVQLGTALSKVPDATDDQGFIAAITAYNTKADAYTNAFVAMVTLFSSQGITFEETDAGSVFSFRR